MAQIFFGGGRGGRANNKNDNGLRRKEPTHTRARARTHTHTHTHTHKTTSLAFMLGIMIIIKSLIDCEVNVSLLPNCRVTRSYATNDDAGWKRLSRAVIFQRRLGGLNDDFSLPTNRVCMQVVRVILGKNVSKPLEVVSDSVSSYVLCTIYF